MTNTWTHDSAFIAIEKKTVEGMSRYQERTCWTRSVSYIEHADYTELGKARAE